MRDINTIVVKSEFRPGTTKVFKNSEDKAVTKQLYDKKHAVESFRAAFFDVDGIEAIELQLA